MSHTKKILLIIFVLLLVTIGELAYYFIYIFQPQPSIQLTQSQLQISTLGAQLNNQKISPTLVLDWNNPKHIDIRWRKVNPDLAVDAKVINSLAIYKKGLLKSSIITNVHQGKIILLDSKGGKAFYDYYDYKLKITVAHEDNLNIRETFYLSEDDLSKTKFFKLENSKEKPITIDELEIGDLIIFEETIDAMKAIPVPTPTYGYDYLTKSWGYNRIMIKITKVL